jgi:acyl dehydratase
VSAGIDTDLPGLAAHAGSHLGFTEWREMTQERVDAFAEVTEDRNYIHVDPERAAAGPFGGTVAHGYLTLSLLAPLSSQVLVVTDTVMGVNYGLNKVRFPAPVPVGAKVRLSATLKQVEEVAGGLQVTLSAVIEREGGDKPVCIAEPVYRYYGG